MKTSNLKKYKFRGGVDIGIPSSTWPFGILEFDANSMILRDLMFDKKIEFLKKDIERVEIRKVLPIIGYGIQIRSKIKSQNDAYIFWYVGFHFQNFINLLKELNYI